MNTSLNRDLQRMRRRIRLLLVEKHACMLGTVAAAVAVVMTLLSSRFFDLGEPLMLASVVLLGIIGGAIWGFARKLTPFAVARAAEKRLDLKERLSSAVSLSTSADEVVKALTDDAAKHVEGVDPRQVFPHRFNRETGVFCGALIVLLGAYFAPQLPTFQSKTRQQEVKLMREQGHKFRKLAKESLKRVAPSNKDIVKRVALNMDALGKKLESGRMTRKQAMLAMNKLSKDIKDSQDRLASQNEASKSMSQADKEVKDAAKNLAEKMLQQIDKEQQANAANGKTDPKLEELKKRLKDLQASSGPMSKSQMQKIENELSQYMSGQKGANMPPELAAYMSELMKNGDYQKAMELMSELSKKLGTGQMSKMDAKALEEQLKAMAKALKGTNMDELAKQMKKAAEALTKMDPKEAAKLLQQCKNMQLKPMDLAKLGKMSGG